MKAHGFTLFELLITFVILVILLTICLPSFSSQIQRTKTKTAALDLYVALQKTRSMAVAYNKRAVIKNKSDWSNGWEIFVDSNSNGIIDGNEQIAVVQGQFSDISITANAPVRDYVSFIGTGESRHIAQYQGGAFQAGTITVCAKKINEGYKLILARSGRVRMADANSNDCNSPNLN